MRLLLQVLLSPGLGEDNQVRSTDSSDGCFVVNWGLVHVLQEPRLMHTIDVRKVYVHDEDLRFRSSVGPCVSLLAPLLASGHDLRLALVKVVLFFIRVSALALFGFGGSCGCFLVLRASGSMCLRKRQDWQVRTFGGRPLLLGATGSSGFGLGWNIGSRGCDRRCEWPDNKSSWDPWRLSLSTT